MLLDDNFCSILFPIMHGRNMIDNLSKFLQLQLTFNTVALLLVFTGACLFSDGPFTATQLILTKFLIDMVTMAFVTEAPGGHTTFENQPRSLNTPVNSYMRRNIIGQAIFQITVLLVLMYKVRDLFDLSYEDSDPFYPNEEDMLSNPERTEWKLFEPTVKLEAYTIVFQTFVFMQIFNMINSRKLSEYNVFAGLLENWTFLLIVIGTLIV